jgi:hypothetical protein
MTRISWVESLRDFDTINVVDVGDAWPAEVEIERDGALIRGWLHAAPVTTHARGRSGEVRLQPPGQYRPVLSVDRDHQFSIIVGFMEGSESVVAIPAGRHMERNERWTVTFNDALLLEAASSGWTSATRPVRHSASETEDVVAFLAPLLPAYMLMEVDGSFPEPLDISLAVRASGLVEEPQDSPSRRRALTATYGLQRTSGTSGRVIRAYDGKCAMCGIGLGIVVGAHVYPVAAGDSTDALDNVVCLCENHHRLFDSHGLWLDPNSREIVMNPAYADVDSAASQAFLDSTFSHLSDPVVAANRISAKNIARRNDYFTNNYAWLERDVI